MLIQELEELEDVKYSKKIRYLQHPSLMLLLDIKLILKKIAFLKYKLNAYE